MNTIAAYAAPRARTLSDYLGALRHHRLTALVVSLGAIILTAVIALVWPPIYRSTATILIEQQEIPRDLVRSTVTTFADQRIQIINQRVMTRGNLMEVIKKYDLYAKERRSKPMEVVIDKMRDDIQLKMVSADVVDPRSGSPTKATIAFTLSYENESPQLSQKVANELTSLFLNENLTSRREMAAQATDFLTDELNQVSDQISEYEKRLAKFKEDNAESLPDMAQYNRQLTDRLDRDLEDVEQNLHSAKERRVFLVSQLAQISPNEAIYSEGGERILSPVDRLKALQAKYVSVAAIYAPDHPDLVRMRKEIASLQEEVGQSAPEGKGLEAALASARGELAEDRKHYGDDHPTVLRLQRQVTALEEALAKQGPSSSVNTAVTKDADNPAYLQLQAQLQALDIEAGALEKRKTELTTKLEDLDKRLAVMPAVEGKYQELARDYENAWGKYKELKAKQMEAKLGQALETERKGERFTLIDPPMMPEKPASPNRLAIMMLGMVVSLGGGLGSVAVRDAVDGVVRGERGVTQLMEMPPLAGIPYIETAKDRQRDKRRRLIAVGVAVAVLLAAVLIEHFFFIPLDVLWFAVLRHF